MAFFDKKFGQKLLFQLLRTNHHALQRRRRGHCVVEPHGRPCKPWVITILEPTACSAACAVTRQMPRLISRRFTGRPDYFVDARDYSSCGQF